MEEDTNTPDSQLIDVSLLNAAVPEDEKRIKEAFEDRNWNEIKSADSWVIFKTQIGFNSYCRCVVFNSRFRNRFKHRCDVLVWLGRLRHGQSRLKIVDVASECGDSQFHYLLPKHPLTSSLRRFLVSKIDHKRLHPRRFYFLSK